MFYAVYESVKNPVLWIMNVMKQNVYTGASSPSHPHTYTYINMCYIFGSLMNLHRSYLFLTKVRFASSPQYLVFWYFCECFSCLNGHQNTSNPLWDNTMQTRLSQRSLWNPLPLGIGDIWWYFASFHQWPFCSELLCVEWKHTVCNYCESLSH